MKRGKEEKEGEEGTTGGNRREDEMEKEGKGKEKRKGVHVLTVTPLMHDKLFIGALYLQIHSTRELSLVKSNK